MLKMINTGRSQQLLGLCAKDLISSVAKYGGSCHKMFLRVFFSKSNKTFVEEDFDDIRGSGLADVSDSVYEVCEKLIKSSQIVEFKEIGKLMQDETNKRGMEIPQSGYNNLTLNRTRGILPQASSSLCCPEMVNIRSSNFVTFTIY